MENGGAVARVSAMTAIATALGVAIASGELPPAVGSIGALALAVALVALVWREVSGGRPSPPPGPVGPGAGGEVQVAGWAGETGR